ncbi:Hypothetical predicted protein [Paramuricea clavata]|uniref:Uncharacterized protein n=1 Tax=Paramuricea clavata TaxID=317549 RepID=A0A6S7JB30_PARCT|nr:Hypothetical predicted protein [Paramuricea clavata]
MASNYRELSPKKRGRPVNKLSVKLFLLDPDNEITKVTKETCSREAINQLMQKGCGPPQPEHCTNPEKDKVEFSLELTNVEFKQKLVEIYSKLENACFVLMKADRKNKLEELDPGTCCYRCYTPNNIYDSNRGQGRLYIRIIAENEISMQCTHGISRMERLRSTVSGSQLLYVPILPKPAPAVSKSIGVGAESRENVVTFVAMPTNRQLPVSGNHGIESRPSCTPRITSTLDLTSSSIVVPQTESTLPVQNSGNMVAQRLLSSSTTTSVNESRLPACSSGSLTAQSPPPASAIISETETRPPVHSSDNMVSQNYLPLSIIVSQAASTPAVHSSGNVVTQSQLSMSAVPRTASTPPLYSSGNMVLQSPFSVSAIVPQTASTPPLYSSGNVVTRSPSSLSSIVPQTASTPAVHSSDNMVTQNPLLFSATVPQTASTPPLQNSDSIVRRRQLPTSASVSQTASNQPDIGHLQTTVSGTMAHQGQFPRHAPFTADEFDLEEIMASLTDSLMTDTDEDSNMNVFQEKYAGFQMPNVVTRTLNNPSLFVTPPPIPSSGFAAFDPWVKPPQSRGLVDMSNEVQANSSNVQIFQGTPTLDLTQSSIVVPQTESTLPVQNSGNMLTQRPLFSSTSTSVNESRLPASNSVSLTAQNPSPASVIISETRPPVHSFGNMVTQINLPLSIIVPQTSSAPTVHSSDNTVKQIHLPLSIIVPQTASTPPVHSSGNMVTQSPLSLSAIVPQTVSTPPLHSSSNMVTQNQSPLLTVTSHTPSTPAVHSSGNMVTQGPLSMSAIVSQTVSTPPLQNSVNMVRQNQLPTSAFVSQTTSRLKRPLLSTGTSVNESRPPACSSGSLTTQVSSPWLNAGLDDMADMSDEMPHGDWLTNNANSSNVQANLDLPETEEFAGKHVKLLVDNTMAVFSINNMGTCHSKANNTLVAKIWEWCIINNTWPTVAHIPGKQNTVADRESRRETEWSLNKDIFNAVVSKLGFSPNIVCLPLGLITRLSPMS